MSEAAISFLKRHGDRSLISLGCGNLLNRLDNHIRLFVQCGLEYYVGIDRVSEINFNPATAFSDPESVLDLLSSHYAGKHEKFFDKIKLFPNTPVEELLNLRCQVVVCQRVLPFRHWEKIITSMNPLLVLQEDLKGCELQNISGENYKKTFPGVIHYQLKPFRPNRFVPAERNILLWRRRDFYPCLIDMKPWWTKMFFCLGLNKNTTHQY